MRTRLPEHLEQFAGPIAEGWPGHSDALEDRALPFQVVRFESGPTREWSTYSTLGLSDSPLRSPASDKFIRHELIALFGTSSGRDLGPSLLFQLGAEALDTGRAYVRGQVIGPRNALAPSSRMTSIYVTAPSYFPEDFAVCESEIGPIVIAWLVPITTREAEYARRVGWSAFEDALAAQQPDLTDLNRNEMSL